MDFEELKATRGEIADNRLERYLFYLGWRAGDAIRLLRIPGRATLQACDDGSVDWETTKNLFIEGENLEVLTVLYKY